MSGLLLPTWQFQIRALWRSSLHVYHWINPLKETYYEGNDTLPSVIQNNHQKYRQCKLASCFGAFVDLRIISCDREVVVTSMRKISAASSSTALPSFTSCWPQHRRRKGHLTSEWGGGVGWEGGIDFVTRYFMCHTLTGSLARDLFEIKNKKQ